MSPSRRRIITVVKTILTIVVILAVGYQFWKIFQDPDIQNYRPAIRVPELLLAGLCYIGAHTLWGTFFVQLIWNQNSKVPWYLGISAYFLSLVGKYVPGKALVIILRVMILRKYGVSRAVVAVSATYETLTTMAAGALIGVGLLPLTGVAGEVVDKYGNIFWVALAIVAGLPIVLGLLNAGVARIAKTQRGPDARALPSPSVVLLARGLLQASVGWCLLGLSLWLTIRGLSAEAVELDPERFMQATATVAVAYVAGFVFFFIPGGMGVREELLLMMLPRVLPPVAGPILGVVAIITLALRLIWTICEVVMVIVILLVRLLFPKQAEPGPTGAPQPDRGQEWATDRPPSRT